MSRRVRVVSDSVLRLVLVLALSLGCTSFALAQDGPRDRTAADTSDVAMVVQMPDTVVVTASRVEESARTTGRRVAVYTQQDIEALAVTSVDQLLDVVGGVDVQSRGGFGMQSDFTLRGSTFNGVLLLLDGARVNDPMTGHFLMDLPVPLSDIVRVEVLRGPAAAVYGPDALGGVIQLFTRTGLYARGTSAPGTSVGASVRGGSDATYDAGMDVHHVGDRSILSVSAAGQGSDGSPVEIDGAPVTNENGTVRTDFARQVATSAYGHRFDGASLFVRAGVDRRDFSAWHFYTPFASDTAREKTSTIWVQTRLDGTPDATSGRNWQVQMSAKQHQDRYQYNPQSPASEHRSRMINAQAQVSQAVGDVTLTTGLSGQLRGIDSNGLGLHSDATGGVFGIARWQATDRLTLNQSLRADADPTYGLEVTPQLYAALALGRVTLRAGGGRAVRAPNYVERFIEAGGNRGTEDLDAERSWSGEAGVDVHSGQGLNLHVTSFLRRTRDLIDYAQENPDDNVFIARNLLRVRTLGVEVEGRLRRTIGEARLDLGATYTWMDADLETQETVAAYKYARSSARHLMQTTARVRVGDVSLGLQGLWKDRQVDAPFATSTYAVAHGRLGYHFTVGTTRSTLTLEVRNLTDRDYAEVFDAPLPGRTFLVGGRIRL